MSLFGELHRQHLEVTRRYFLQLGVAGVSALKVQSAWAESDQSILDEALDEGIGTQHCLGLRNFHALGEADILRVDLA